MPGPDANKGGNKSGSSKSGSAKSGRDTGKDTPSYKGASVRGLTSKDPGNVARNRAGAAKYSSKSERMAASTRDTNVDRAAAQAAARSFRPATPAAAAAAAPKKTMTPAAPKPSMMATRAPAGYRPGIDPEFNYRTGVAGTPTVARVAPTVTLAKGGKAPRKKK